MNFQTTPHITDKKIVCKHCGYYCTQSSFIKYARTVQPITEEVFCREQTVSSGCIKHGRYVAETNEICPIFKLRQY